MASPAPKGKPHPQHQQQSAASAAQAALATATSAAATVDPDQKEKEKIKESGKAIVKAVLSGDTVTLLLPPKQPGPPEEKDLTFSSLTAPRLGRQGKKDEAYAWQSREFLRNLCIGKQVDYVIEYSIAHASRTVNYGFISIAGANLALLSATEGLCRVKPLRDNQKEVRASYQELVAAGQEAEAKGRGMYSKDQSYAEKSVRNVVNKFNSFALYQQFKSTPIKGIVDFVREGTTLRLLILIKDNTWYEILLHLSGVQSPGYKIDNAKQSSSSSSSSSSLVGEEAVVGETGDESSSSSSGSSSSSTTGGGTKLNFIPEPFAPEAKYFTERLLLHRDVQISLEGVDKQGNFFGTVLFEGKNIAEQLLSQGLAKFVEWNANPQDKEKFRALEKRAQQQKLRIHSLAPKTDKGASGSGPSTSTQSSGDTSGGDTHGKVREILSGGTVVVVDQASSTRRTINLSSVKVPRMSTRDEVEDEPWAWEAKDFLRRRLIGKPVRCVYDYSRIGENGVERHFYTVYSDNKSVAVRLVELGYAEVLYHKADEKRSVEYEALLTAENKAKAEGAGKFGKKLAPVHHINNLSKGEQARARAKQLFGSFQRAGRMSGVVDYVFSATKLKIYCEKQSAFLNFAVGGIRGPESEAIANEATEFTREKCHQREVEFEVEAQDKGGNFIGNLYLKKTLFSLKLIEQGYAAVHEPSASKSPHFRDLISAQEIAQSQKKKMWKDWEPGQEIQKEQARAAAAAAAGQVAQASASKIIFVTEIMDAAHFYAQFQTPELAGLEDLMAQVQESNPSTAATFTFQKVGDVCLSQFSADKKWYRASVVERPKGNQVTVLYVDYGNSEVVNVSGLKAIDKKFTSLPFQAKECFLAYLKVPDAENDDFGREAAEFFRDLVWEKSMFAHVEYTEGNKYYLSVGEPNSGVLVNAALVKAGLAQLDKAQRPRGAGAAPGAGSGTAGGQVDGARLWAVLKEEEEQARKAHRNIWQYGDIDEDEEDESSRRPRRR